MCYNKGRYFIEENGDYRTQQEAERAVSNGDLERLPNGDLWDKQTGETFWSDGTKKS